MAAPARLDPPHEAIPPEVWQAASFQRWYRSQCDAGNSLEGAHLLWSFRAGPDSDAPVFWAMRVAVRVAAEERVKSNEIVISRPDSSSVALYRPSPVLDETVVVLVREFRSPASTPDGFVRELPGGSGPASDPLDQGAAEVAEETGLAIDPARLRAHGSRQVAATLSAHHTHLFSAPITADELAWLREHQAEIRGDGGTERTHVEIATFGEIRRGRLVDWSTLGMLTQALLDG